jgi:hypothetical protein
VADTAEAFDDGLRGVEERTVVGGVERGALRDEESDHPLVNELQGRLVDVPAGDPGLIRYHDDEVAVVAESADRVADAGQQPHLVRVSDIAPVLDDRTISIEEDGRA